MNEPKRTLGETKGSQDSRHVRERRKLPKQERAKATVDRILNAAVVLVEGQGFASVTTGAIAEKAGVNIASLYQYFPNRETILLALYEEAAGDGAQKLNQLAMKVVYGELEDIVPKIMKLLLSHYEAHSVVLLRMPNEVPEIRRLTRVVPFEKMIGSTIRYYLQQHPEFRAKDTPRHLFFLENLIVSNLSRFITDPPPNVSRSDFLAHLSRIIVAYLKGSFA